MFDLYPYTNFHELNQDWILSILKKFENELKQAIDYKTIHYADPLQWNITTQYAPNTVVVDENTGIAYISKDAVPSGILLSDKNYWMVIFDYQKIYNKIMSGVAFNEKDNETASKDLLVNDLVWYHGNLYRATRAISTGSRYIIGTNLVATTIESLLSNYYGRDRVAQLLNDTVNVSGDYTINAGDIAETANHVTINSKQDMLLDADGKLTEYVSGNRETDIDGNDSLHVDGVTTINRGGAVTEVYNNSKNTKIVGNVTNEFENSYTETYKGKRILNTVDNEINATSYFINFLKHTLDARLLTNGITSVKTYGAKGDGVTNDTEAVQAALNSNCAIIIFDSGEYLCDRLNVPSNKILIGKNAHIHANKNNTCLFINKSDGSIGADQANTNIIFYGLEISGENAENCSLITMGHCNNIFIINCYLHDCRGYHSIAFNSCSQCLIENCTITEYGGASSTTESIQLDICNDAGSFQWFGPYDSYPTQNIKICNCTIIGKSSLINNTGGYCAIGNHLIADNAKINRILISNCVIKSFSRGISFICGSMLKINDSIITECNCGIYAEKIDCSTISNNTLIGNNNNVINTYYIGIHVINTKNILVDSNFIQKFGKTGILIEGIGNKISNNHVRLNKQFGIRIGMNDQATLYDGNFCFNNGLEQAQPTLSADLMIRIEKTSGDYFGSVTITNNKATTFYNDLPTRETEPQNSQFCFNIIKNSIDIKDPTLKANYNIVNSNPIN